jgi:hypothetical protein
MSQVHAQARTTPRTRTEIKEASGSLAELWQSATTSAARRPASGVRVNARLTARTAPTSSIPR